MMKCSCELRQMIHLYDLRWKTCFVAKWDIESKDIRWKDEVALPEKWPLGRQYSSKHTASGAISCKTFSYFSVICRRGLVIQRIYFFSSSHYSDAQQSWESTATGDKHYTYDEESCIFFWFSTCSTLLLTSHVSVVHIGRLSFHFHTLSF